MSVLRGRMPGFPGGINGAKRPHSEISQIARQSIPNLAIRAPISVRPHPKSSFEVEMIPKIIAPLTAPYLLRQALSPKLSLYDLHRPAPPLLFWRNFGPLGCHDRLIHCNVLWYQGLPFKGLDSVITLPSKFFLPDHVAAHLPQNRRQRTL